MRLIARVAIFATMLKDFGLSLTVADRIGRLERFDVLDVVFS
jgi:hypothetical protein